MRVLRGKHSNVYVKDGVAVKVFLPQFRYNFWKEVRYLTVLQSRRFVPRLYDFDPEELKVEMEFIEGEPIRDFIKRAEVDEVRDVLKSCLDICHRLDRMRIQKEEMNHPGKHVLIREGDVYFIDFERSYDNPNPSNVTQFISYICSRFVMERAEINRPSVETLREYKRFYSYRSYKKLKDEIFG